MQQNITDTFLSLLNSRFSDSLPERIRSQARYCLLDYLGVTLAGASLLKNKQRLVLDGFDMDGDSGVIGSDISVTAMLAAMANGVSSHVIELDDGHRIGMIHLGAPVISALLAIAEKEALSPERFLLGMVVGYEVAIRLACCVQPGCKLKGYHATGTCGTVGAAMGIAAALGFDFEQMKSALSAATTSAAGLLEMIEGDSEMKAFNVGRAAMDGVMAAYLGRARFKAPADALGGKRGFLNAMTDAPKLEFLSDFSGGRFMMETIYVKPYAACRHCHPSIEAALRIREMNGFRIDEVEGIGVETYKLAVAGHDHTEIQGVNSAKMSIPYSLAVALVKGKAGLNEYTEPVIQDPIIQSVTDKVKVESEENLTRLCPQKRVAVVAVKTKSGTFVHRVDYPKGEPENPLSPREMEDKFRALAMFGGLAPADCDVVVDALKKDAFDLRLILKTVCRK